MLMAVDMLAQTSLEFGALARVQDDLIKTPPPPHAPKKLVKALDQMALVFNEIDGAIMDYVTLDFEPPPSGDQGRDQERLRKNTRLLQALAAGHTKTELSTLRGHCTEITAIYQRDLSPWFRRVLSKGDVDEIERLFMTFVADFDVSIVSAVAELSQWITEHARATLELVRADRFTEANDRILADDKEIFDARVKTLDGLNLLRQLKATFLALA